MRLQKEIKAVEALSEASAAGDVEGIRQAIAKAKENCVSAEVYAEAAAQLHLLEVCIAVSICHAS